MHWVQLSQPYQILQAASRAFGETLPAHSCHLVGTERKALSEVLVILRLIFCFVFPIYHEHSSVEQENGLFPAVEQTRFQS